MSRIYSPAIGSAAGFDSEQPQGALVPANDFPEASQATSLHQKYVQLATYYSAPTLNGTTIFGGVTFYLTGDSSFSDIGAGCIAWEREWARLPSQRIIYETIDYSMPAVLVGTTFNTTYAVSSVASNTGSNTMSFVVSTGTWKVGQLVGLQWTAGTTLFLVSGFSIQNTSTLGGNTFLSVYPLNASFIGSVTIPATGRYIASLSSAVSGRYQPTNLATRAKTTFDYFLPGVSAGVTTGADISIYTRFKVTDTQGVETQYLNNDSTPSPATWSGWVAAPMTNMQDAQDSTLRLWKGQIYERQRVQFAPL